MSVARSPRRSPCHWHRARSLPPRCSPRRIEIRLANVEVAPGRRLDVVSVFFDVTDGLPSDAIAATLAGWRAEGIESACVAEAFAPDDQRNEDAVAELARAAGLAVCTSSELTG